MNIQEATTDDLREELARREALPHDARYPHGECECRSGCQCAGVPGPAAEAITRDGKRMNVCTRCTLTGDTDRVWLITEDTPTSPFQEWDGLGLMCAAMHLATKRREREEAALPNGKEDGT